MPSKPSSSGGGSRKHGDDRKSSKDDRKAASSRGGSSKDGGSKSGNSKDGDSSSRGGVGSSRKSHDPHKPIIRDFAPAASSAPQQLSATSQIVRDFASAALSAPESSPPVLYESPAQYDSPSTGDELESIGTSELGHPAQARRPAQSRGSRHSASTGDDLASVGTSELRGAFEHDSTSPPRRGAGYIAIGYRPGSVASSEIRKGIHDDLLDNDGVSQLKLPSAVSSSDRMSSLELPAPELDPAQRNLWYDRQRSRIIKAPETEHDERSWTSSSDFKGATPSQRREFGEMEAKFKKLGVALGYDMNDYAGPDERKEKKKRGFLVGPSETESNVVSSSEGGLRKEYAREAKAIREKRIQEGTAPELKAPDAEPMTEKDKAILGIIEKQYVGFGEFVRPRVRSESASSASTTCSTPRLQSSGEQSTESAYKKEEARVLGPDRPENTKQASSHSGTPNYKPTAFIKPPTLEKKKSLDLLSPIAIPKSGKVLPKGEFGRIEEQLKDYRQMMADALAFAHRFSANSKSGWGAQARAQAESGNEEHLSQRINYSLPTEFAHRVCKEVYKNDLVHRYDDFVARNRGLKASYLKRMAEDDAASGIRIRPDKERYANWLELKLFCKEEEKRSANAIRYQKNSRIEAMKIAAEHGTSLDEGLRLQRKGSARDSSKFKPSG